MNQKYKAILESRNRTYWEMMIDEWIFDEVDRALLKRFLLDKARYSDLEDEFHIGTSSLKRRIYKAEDRLFSKVSFRI